VLVHQTITLLERGLAAGSRLHRSRCATCRSRRKNLVVTEPLTSPMLAAFVHFPAEIASADQQRLRAAAVAAYRDSVAPAYRQLSTFLRDKYVPGARKTIGMRDLPNGMAWYQVRARTSPRPISRRSKFTRWGSRR